MRSSSIKNKTLTLHHRGIGAPVSVRKNKFKRYVGVPILLFSIGIIMGLIMLVSTHKTLLLAQTASASAAANSEESSKRYQEKGVLLLKEDFQITKPKRKPQKQKLDNTNKSTSASTTTTSSIWESSTVLPQWLKDYFQWHSQQTTFLKDHWKPKLAKLNQTEAAKFLWDQPDAHTLSENKIRFFVVRCFRFDRRCGGLADRLLPLPYLLSVAANTSRVLLIHFQKPALLEEYLTPPQGGIDWRIPEWLLPAFHFTPDSRRFKATGNLEWHASYPGDTVVQSIFQSYHYGAETYDERRTPHEPTFREVLRDAWRVLFTPTPPIQKRIQLELNLMGIRPGHYAAIHVRALYAVKEDQRDLKDIEQWSRNAVHCASQIYPGGPYFIASDSNHATKTAVQYGREVVLQQSKKLQAAPLPVGVVVTRSNQKPPIHSDRIPVVDDGGGAPGNKAVVPLPYQASDYYDTYVDLYLMGMAQCVTHGIGGYGKMASYLSYNSSCSFQFFKNSLTKCEWNAPPQSLKPNEEWVDQMSSLLSHPMDIG